MFEPAKCWKCGRMVTTKSDGTLKKHRLERYATQKWMGTAPVCAASGTKP